MTSLSNQTSVAPIANLQRKAKLDEVNRLLRELGVDLEKDSLLPHERYAALEQLKVYGRDPQDADPIFTKEGIQILARHAFDSSSTNTSRNALRCLANALLLKSATRQIFVDLKYEGKACEKLRRNTSDDEFLVSRIIFLTTYNTSLNIEGLIDEHHLAENITQNLLRHASHYDAEKKAKDGADPMDDMALTETLKLLFNLSHFCPQRIQSFTTAIPHIVTILSNREVVSSKPLDMPIGPLVNSLLNLDLSDKAATKAIIQSRDPTAFGHRLIQLLDLAIQSYKEEDLDQQVSPLVTLLRKVYETVPAEVKDSLKRVVLPTDDDRKQPLGRAETLPSRILRLSTSPVAPQLREGISSLLFEMSNKDARTFVQNFGYGFASGYLFQHKISLPEDTFSEASLTGDKARSDPNLHAKLVNPITGQRLDFESRIDGPEMSQKEKEREAERLMVLFERLKKNGIISAENPVAKAQHEGQFEGGRFQEVDSDDDDA